MSARTAGPTATIAFGIDVGATSIKAAAVTANGQILSTISTATPLESSDRIADAIVGVIASLARDHASPTGIGIGTPGWTSADRRSVVYSPNLPWLNEPLADRIENSVGVPVVLENDANAAAWGEYRFGVARGSSSTIALTLGSGVGGAIVLNGALVRGHDGCAGELGHTLRETNGRPCVCGRTGCMENYVSGRALMRATDQPDGDSLLSAARSGDHSALELYRLFGAHLGRGLADSVILLNPELVVVGGGVAEGFEFFATHAEAALGDELGPHWRGISPRVVAAQLGSDAGRIGVADLALHGRTE